MTAARSNRKRSRDDLEDSDECLPISKRINSLNLEGQISGMGRQDCNALGMTGLQASDMAGTQALPHLTFGLNHQMNGLHAVPGPATLNPHAGLISETTVSQRLPTISEQSQDVRLEGYGIPLDGNMVQHLDGAHGDRFSHFSQQAHPMQHAVFEASQRQLQASCARFESPPCSSGLSSQQRLFLNQENLNASEIADTVSNHNCSFHAQQQSSPISSSMGKSSQPSTNLSNDLDMRFHMEQLPSGSYDPELDSSENPHYFSINQLLYEAHLSRVQRDNLFPPQ